MNTESLKDLSSFTCTEQYYKTMFSRLVYTDGVKFLAQNADCYWLIDLIVSYQIHKKIRVNQRLQEFQIWQLKVNLDKKTAVLTCIEDTDLPASIKKNIGYTTFPIPEIKLYVENGVLLLPSER